VQRGGNIIFPDFDAGISLNNAKGCKISSNNIADNGCFGIHLLNNYQNTISGNNLTLNTDYAIDLTTSSNNIVSSNTAIFNANIGIGMHVSSVRAFFTEHFLKALVLKSVQSVCLVLWDNSLHGLLAVFFHNV
jgi:parallel beta-helix repeat protein